MEADKLLEYEINCVGKRKEDSPSAVGKRKRPFDAARCCDWPQARLCEVEKMNSTFQAHIWKTSTGIAVGNRRSETTICSLELLSGKMRSMSQTGGKPSK
jgi:hypothetical protein